MKLSWWKCIESSALSHFNLSYYYFCLFIVKWCEALFLILTWYGQWCVFYPSTEICTTCTRLQKIMLHSSSCFEFLYSSNKIDVRAFRIRDPIEIWISLHFGTFPVFTKMWAGPFFENFHEKMIFPNFIKDHFYDVLRCQGY